jgi:hypothetical protein
LIRPPNSQTDPSPTQLLHSSSYSTSCSFSFPCPCKQKIPKLSNPTNGYTPVQIQKSTKKKKQIEEEEEEIANTNKAKTNTSRTRNLTTIWISKEVLAATILSIRPPNSHPDPSPPPLLHLLFLLLFV